jgi:hypothetical protein
MTGPGREDVEDARVELYERLFGPLPGMASALQNLMGIWPGGCLLQIDGRRIAGLAVTVSHGLTNPGLPPPVRVESQAVREERDGRFTRREQSTQLVPAPADRRPRPGRVRVRAGRAHSAPAALAPAVHELGRPPGRDRDHAGPDGVRAHPPPARAAQAADRRGPGSGQPV